MKLLIGEVRIWSIMSQGRTVRLVWQRIHALSVSNFIQIQLLDLIYFNEYTFKNIEL